MKHIPLLILRIGLAITFLWIGVLILAQPESWGELMAPWALRLLPIPLTQAMIGAAITDIVVGGLLLFNVLPWIAALVGAIHIAIVLIVSGITTITVRDIGLLSATLALTLETLPPSLLKSFRHGPPPPLQ